MSGYRGSVNSGHSRPVSIEDQRNSGNRAIVFIKGSKGKVSGYRGSVNSGYRGSVNSGHSGPVSKEDQWNSGTVGTEE